MLCVEAPLPTAGTPGSQPTLPSLLRNLSKPTSDEHATIRTLGVMQRLRRPLDSQRLAYRVWPARFAACNLVPLCLASIAKCAIRRLSGPQRCARCACDGLRVFPGFRLDYCFIHCRALCRTKRSTSSARTREDRCGGHLQLTAPHQGAAAPSLWRQPEHKKSVASASQRAKTPRRTRSGHRAPSRRRRTRRRTAETENASAALREPPKPRRQRCLYP